jgi:hypothetical protein
MLESKRIVDESRRATCFFSWEARGGSTFVLILWREHRPRERLCPWWRHIGHRREQVETNNVKRRRNVRIDHVISAEVGPYLLDGVVVQTIQHLSSSV